MAIQIIVRYMCFNPAGTIGRDGKPYEQDAVQLTEQADGGHIRAKLPPEHFDLVPAKMLATLKTAAKMAAAKEIASPQIRLVVPLKVTLPEGWTFGPPVRKMLEDGTLSSTVYANPPLPEGTERKGTTLTLEDIEALAAKAETVPA